MTDITIQYRNLGLQSTTIQSNYLDLLRGIGVGRIPGIGFEPLGSKRPSLGPSVAAPGFKS